MSDDLDLRAIDRRHEPDPRFVAALGDRLEAIMANPVSPDVSTDEATVRTIELEPGDSQRPRARHQSRRVFGAAIVLAAATVAAFAVVASQDRSSLEDPHVYQGAPQPNGWVALDTDGDIYLVRPGQDPRRLDVAGSDAADDSCPTWSPDGTRLSFGRLTGSSDTAASDAELVIVPVDGDGAVGTPKVIALDGFHALPRFEPHPCATWAADGRWVAFAGSGDVWVADTQTGAVRRLPDLPAFDLEWRPGTDELAIAGDAGPDRGAANSSTPVTIYSASTGELRQLGSVRAALLTWSPDGSTLAYQGGENDEDELWLVDADGANDRLLAHVGEAVHGVGPVWSPTGERIAFQRLISRTGEKHRVVLVDVADGSETIIEPPETEGPSGPRCWYPYSVTWSPDGTTLLYSAWDECGAPTGVVAVRVDNLEAPVLGAVTPTDVTVLTEASSLTGFVYDHVWVPVQMWGRQPE
jgi:dipeptidyl aminopeptidase/acylaminoacyl peptidase